MNNEELETFEQKLKAHDWTYEMSDCSTSYSRGSNNDKALRSLAKDLGDAGVNLYNKYYESYAYPKDCPLK